MCARVSVGRRNVEGVIWSLRRVSAHPLKPLEAILSGPLFHARERAWIKAIAENCLESLALIVKSLIFVRRPLKRVTLRYPLPPARRQGKGPLKPPVFVQFTEKIEDVLPRRVDGQVLVLVPDNVIAQRVFNACNLVGLPVCRFSQSLPLTKRRAVLIAITAGEPLVIIATHSGVFLPFFNLMRIIVVETTLPAHRQWDLHPRYDARLAALLLARVTNAALVFQSSLPSIELSALPKDKVKNIGDLPKIPVQILARSDNHDRPFLPDTEAHIQEVLSRGRSVLLFQNIVGRERFYRCATCGHLLQCTTCGQALQRQGKSLICLHCRLVQSPVRYFCPQCGSPRVHPRRIGTAAIEEEVHRLLPNILTIRIDRDSMPREAIRRALETKKSEATEQPQPTVYVATEQIFSLVQERFGLTVIIDADTLLPPLAYDAAEQALRMITRVSQMRENTETAVLLQTSLPHFPLFKALASDTLSEWLTAERLERATLGVPPYGTLIRFTKTFSSVTRAQSGIAVFQRTLKNTPRIRLGWRITDVPRRVRADVLLRGPRSILLNMYASLPQSWSVDPAVPLTEFSGAL